MNLTPFAFIIFFYSIIATYLLEEKLSNVLIFQNNMSANENRTKILSESFSPARDSILSHLDLESMLASIKAFPEWTEGISSSKIFKEKVANTTLIDSCGETGRRLTSEYLINHGADVNIKTKMGSALHLTVMGDDTETCQKLVSAGANVNTTDNSESTPLHLAAFYKKLELSHILISGGADLNLQNFNGRTPLHWAVFSSDLEFVQLFISAGSDLNIQDKKGQTPLHHLLKIHGGDHSRHKAVVDLLIQHGADLTLKDSSGYTPLETHKLEIQRGADGFLKLKDSSGDTPLDTPKNCLTCQEKYIK